MVTGEISTVHESSLKKWPYIVFEKVQSVSISYDLTKQTAIESGHNYVVYNIYLDEQLEETLLKGRPEILADWIRDMFWNEIEVTVVVDQNVVLHSLPKQKTSQEELGIIKKDIDQKEEETDGLNKDRA